MPTLLEIQAKLGRSLARGEPCPRYADIIRQGIEPEARLAIYRNTVESTLIKALRLAFPTIFRLVGDAFFEAAAHGFIADHPARSAYLAEYGEDFPGFLRHFPPAGALGYLEDMARLDWAVNRALHAPDIDGLLPQSLTVVREEEWSRVSFTAHPSVGLVRSAYPIDDIWRGVLSPREHPLESVDLAAGPVWLIVQRVHGETRVDRVPKGTWNIISRLCASEPLGAALGVLPGPEVSVLLAGELAAGRFVAFRVEPDGLINLKLDRPR